MDTCETVRNLFPKGVELAKQHMRPKGCLYTCAHWQAFNCTNAFINHFHFDWCNCTARFYKYANFHVVHRIVCILAYVRMATWHTVQKVIWKVSKLPSGPWKTQVVCTNVHIDIFFTENLFCEPCPFYVVADFWNFDGACAHVKRCHSVTLFILHGWNWHVSYCGLIFGHVSIFPSVKLYKMCWDRCSCWQVSNCIILFYICIYLDPCRYKTASSTCSPLTVLS